MSVFSIAVNIHDHNYYDGKVHYLAERHTRRKHNLIIDDPDNPEPSREFFREHFLPNYGKHNVFAFTCSNRGYKFTQDLMEDVMPDMEFLKFKPTNLWEFRQTDQYYYIDHHQSHAAYAFLSSGYHESDILAIDGRGWQFSCIFVNKSGQITDLTDKVYIGGLWNKISQDIGFKYLGAGKIMGLAAYGEHNDNFHSVIEYYMSPASRHRLPKGYNKLISQIKKEDIAYTLQYATMEIIKDIIYPLKTSDNLCVAGGVSYNGYMNEAFTKHWTNVHVPPAPGDEGQALGCYMHYKYVKENEVHIPNLYSGVDTQEPSPDLFEGLHYEKKDITTIQKEVAEAISNGAIVGWFQGRSESGNRALGNRSILADPRNPNIKDIINSKIKLREDFRPFAPSVLIEHYKEYFDTNQPSPYMSRIMPVISDKIPGVTHVDKTARIQTVERSINERYYDLINEFYKITGIPMLLNTSFNCQEPIVETPEDAINTFKKCGLDILVIGDYIVRKRHDY